MVNGAASAAIGLQHPEQRDGLPGPVLDEQGGGYKTGFLGQAFLAGAFFGADLVVDIPEYVALAVAGAR